MQLGNVTKTACNIFIVSKHLCSQSWQLFYLQCSDFNNKIMVVVLAHLCEFNKSYHWHKVHKMKEIALYQLKEITANTL